MPKPISASPGGSDAFASFFADFESQPAYHVELAKLHFARDLVGRMEELGLNRAQLAARMGVRPSFITRILSGTHNFELESMVRVARALNASLCIHLQPRGTLTRWFDVFAATPDSAVKASPSGETARARIQNNTSASQNDESFALAS